jgi:hypothetical protein
MALPSLRARTWLPSMMLLVLACCAKLQGQEPETSPDGARAAHLAQMKAVAGSIRLLGNAQDAESAIKLVEEPVLRYTDNTRENGESSLWIWSSGGRPAAILAVELYPKPPRGPRWLAEIASLSESRIAARHAGDLDWAAKSPGLAWLALADAEPPAEKPLRRLAQMKALYRTFTAHESAVVEGRVQLRQLASPLVRYQDEAAGILDGAIFAFANGTNPEVLVVLEAHGAEGAPPRWRAAFAQMTGGAVSVEQDGKEIWGCSEADPPAVRDSYVNAWLAAKPTAE